MAGALSRKGRRQKTVGALRHRVTIQARGEGTRNSFGTVVPTWTDVATVWASVEPVSGRELVVNGQVQANATHRVVMRHREGLSAKNRLIWVTGKPANQVLEIESVSPAVGAENSLEVMCVREEVAA